MSLRHINNFIEATDFHLDAPPVTLPIHRRSTRLLSGNNDDGGRSIGHQSFYMTSTRTGIIKGINKSGIPEPSSSSFFFNFSSRASTSKSLATKRLDLLFCHPPYWLSSYNLLTSWIPRLGTPVVGWLSYPSLQSTKRRANTGAILRHAIQAIGEGRVVEYKGYLLFRA